MQQCLGGDPSAYRLLYDRYSRAMYNTALRIVNGAPDAEDVLQESFTDAFMQLTAFEGRSTFGAWLRQIVVNKSISLLQKRRIQLVDMETAGQEPISEDSLNEEEIELTVANVKKMVRKLPDGYRTVLTLYLFEGYDHEEIAAILNTAQSTVRTQYIRAKQKLLDLLKKEDVYE